jgi:hypothetical protein
MKKITIILLSTLLLNSFSGNAQQYFPFPTSNAFWKVGWGVSGCVPPLDITEYDYQITGDTLIGLYTYHKLKKSGIFYCGDPLYPSTGNENFVGAYRNDTLAKRVYYIPKDSTSESLLYDFNLLTGDTIKGYMEELATNIYPTFYAVIDSIDSVSINSVYRKRWHFHTSKNGMPLWDEGKIIEGIGNTLGLLEGLLPGMDNNGRILCFSENGISLYGFYNPCFLYVVGIETEIIEQTELLIHPNPTTGNITIDLGELRQDVKAILINSLGQILLTQNYTSTAYINLDLDYPKGIYFLQIANEGEVVTKKIIKE